MSNVMSDKHSSAIRVPCIKIPNCKLKDNFFLFYFMVTYIYSTHVLVRPTDKISLLAYLHPSDRHE